MTVTQPSKHHDANDATIQTSDATLRRIRQGQTPCLVTRMTQPSRTGTGTTNDAMTHHGKFPLERSSRARVGTWRRHAEQNSRQSVTCVIAPPSSPPKGLRNA